MAQLAIAEFLFGHKRAFRMVLATLEPKTCDPAEHVTA